MVRSGAVVFQNIAPYFVCKNHALCAVVGKSMLPETLPSLALDMRPTAPEGCDWFALQGVNSNTTCAVNKYSNACRTFASGTGEPQQFERFSVAR